MSDTMRRPDERVRHLHLPLPPLRQNPKAAETKLSEIGTHVLTAAFAIIRMNDIATEEVKRLRRKIKKQGGTE